jgi:glucokinase
VEFLPRDDRHDPDTAVLEIGGTHVTAARVDPTTWEVRAGTIRRHPLHADAAADRILAEILAAANSLDVPAGVAWGVAVPGPFDYRLGIGRFRGVGKFDSLYGHDVGAALRAGIHPTPGRVTFVGDAEAFVVGEWLTGAARDVRRCAGLTIGTGIGSAFLVDGRAVDDGVTVPPGGEVHRLTVNGRPLEDLVSRRAILASYRSALAGPDGGSDVGLDVEGIATAARAGDPTAREVLDTAFQILGAAVAPWVRAFGATVLVVGGSVARSWDLMAGPLRDGLADGGAGTVPVTAGLHLDTSPLAGAAWAAGRRPDGPRGPDRSRPARTGPLNNRTATVDCSATSEPWTRL